MTLPQLPPGFVLDEQPEKSSSMLPTERSEISLPQLPPGFVLDEQPKEEKEGFHKSFNRYLGQIPKALTFLATKGIPEMIQLQGLGESLSELQEWKDTYREKELRAKFPTAPWKEEPAFDEDKFKEAIQVASETFPTTANIFRKIEKDTGLPFEAKTSGQKLFEAGITAAGFKGGDVSKKLTAGIKAPLYSSILQTTTGGDEDTANAIGLLLSQFERTPEGFKLPKQKKVAKVPPGGGSGPGGGISQSEEIIKETTSLPFFKNLVPEHEILEKLSPVMKDSLAQRIKSIGKEPVFKFGEAPKMPTQKPNDVFTLNRNIGNTISPTAIPNTTAASKSIRNEINILSSNEYAKANKLYNKAIPASKTVLKEQPKMVEDLKALVSQISEAEIPSSVQKEIRNIANKYIKLGGKEGAYNKIANSKLIAQIQSNNQKVNHDFLQGRPSNAFIRLNEIFGDAIESTSEIAPEVVSQYREANKAYKKWASKFGSDEILKWRDPSVVAHSKLFKSIENPDQINVLENVLNKSKKGKALTDKTKRHFIEKQFRPYVKDPLKIDSLEFDDLMKEIKPITTPQQRENIRFLLENAREPYLTYERQKTTFNELKKSHETALANYKSELKDFKSKIQTIKKDFPYKSDRAILSDLNSVRGLKRIEKNIPKTKEGEKLIKEIKSYIAANLLTQGKIIPDAKPQSLKKILNDVNKRALLEHTLGKESTNKLVKIVNNIPKIDAKMSNLQKGMKIAKAIGRFIPGARETINAGESLADLWSVFRPAATNANYEAIDLNIINAILENSDKL